LHRYSDRLAALMAPANQFSILCSKLRHQDRPLLDLTISNPTEALADYPHSEIAKALGSITSFQYQPEPFGNLAARTAIVHYLERRTSGLKLSPAHLALTASTSEAYGLLFKLLANPDDEVLVPTPSYPLFDYLARLESVNLRPYRLRYDGSWFIDFESLESAVSARTRAIVLVNPNNPTGSFLKDTEFGRLRDFALSHHLPLISDEVFTDYQFGESSNRLTTFNGRNELLCFTLNGLSKSAGLPQMKLGWIAVNGPQHERDEACERLEMILDTYLSVSAPVQLATEALLIVGNNIHALIRSRIAQNLSLLDELLANQKVHRLHTEGGWSAVLRVPQTLSEEDWITRLLVQHGVIVQPGYFFDMSFDTSGEASFLIVSLLTPELTFANGIRRMLELADEI
jgi:alanine-synthesizing transaminase